VPFGGRRVRKEKDRSIRFDGHELEAESNSAATKMNESPALEALLVVVDARIDVGGAVAEGVVEHQGLLHVLNVRRRVLYEALAVAQIRAERNDLFVRAKAASKQPVLVQLLQPLRVVDETATTFTKERSAAPSSSRRF
jgi:hypothetical protein